MTSKAYPPTWADDEAMRAASRRWWRLGMLQQAQYTAIKAAHPVSYYRPAFWIRLVLFGATLLGIGTGLVFLLFITSGQLNPFAYGTVVLLACLILLESLITNSHHYRSGVDNALQYGALLAWAFLVGYMGRDIFSGSLASPTLWLWLLLVLAALLVALVRYADPLVAATSFVVAVALLTNILLQSALGRLLLPFGVMAAAGALLLALRRLPAQDDYFYYRSAGLVLRTLGLAALYLAGNYLVVREGNAQLVGSGGPSGQIPLAPFFYVFTASIPLVYIWLGLRRHDRLLLNLGLLALAFSLFTLRYYRQVLPPEIAATVGGTVLLMGVLAALRCLRMPRHGFTAAVDAEASPKFNLESLVVAQTAHAPSAPEAGFQFGGGQSGGGGAESSY